MDILFFLRERIEFIRKYYTVASRPFEEIQRQISAEETPYEKQYSEDVTPPYLDEWIDAAASLAVLGAHCISLLSDSLKLYLRESEMKYRLDCARRFPRQTKAGVLALYTACISRIFSPDWTKNPADMRIVEEIILSRNTFQHPEHIHSILVDYRKADIKRHGVPFFTSDHEQRMLADEDLTDLHWLALPTLNVTSEKLFHACDQIELFTAWLDGVMSGPIVNAQGGGTSGYTPLLQILDEIGRAQDAGADVAALALVYVGIDTMALLGCPLGQQSQTRVDFIGWVETYLKAASGSDYQYEGLDLYAARCGLLHAYGSEADLHGRPNPPRKFGYADNGLHRKDDAAGFVLISIAVLIRDFGRAVERFVEAMKADAELKARVDSRMPSLLLTSLLG